MSSLLKPLIGRASPHRGPIMEFRPNVGRISRAAAQMRRGAAVPARLAYAPHSGRSPDAPPRAPPRRYGQRHHM